MSPSRKKQPYLSHFWTQKMSWRIILNNLSIRAKIKRRWIKHSDSFLVWRPKIFHLSRFDHNSYKAVEFKFSLALHVFFGLASARSHVPVILARICICFCHSVNFCVSNMCILWHLVSISKVSGCLYQAALSTWWACGFQDEDGIQHHYPAS